jgi:hypothetical protein
MYKAKDTKEIYIDSLAVNSSNLQRQLASKNVPADEIKEILASISTRYDQELQAIVKECEQDMMALERVPSPLRLFIECMTASGKSLDLSASSHKLIEEYNLAWEDWM